MEVHVHFAVYLCFFVLQCNSKKYFVNVFSRIKWGSDIISFIIHCLLKWVKKDNQRRTARVF